MAKGEKPIGIVWNMNNKRLDSKEEERFVNLFKSIKILLLTSYN